jgi:hypothetical protein
VLLKSTELAPSIVTGPFLEFWSFKSFVISINS